MKKLMHKIRNWWMAPLVEELITQRQQSLSEVATLVKTDVVHQLMQETTDKLISLNHILETTYGSQERKLGLVYRSPQSEELAMRLLSNIAPIFDFYYRRNGDYDFFNVLMHSYEMVWLEIKQCVYTPEGISIESVKFQDLGMSGLLEAIHVFAQGINNENIPDQYTAYNGGLHASAIAQLYKDITSGSIAIDPDNLWGNLLGKALQYSAVEVLSELKTLENASQIRSDVSQAFLETLQEVVRSHGKK